ncbi:MAG: glycosyltransferase family 39 protein, partial [Anaerolineae bacterium]|nr:glycosyltransferase family 39 protein [Anaerolineae bacterium]
MSKSTIRFRNAALWWYVAILLAANLVLLLPYGSPIRVAGALLLICLLPGLSWAYYLLAGSSTFLRLIVAAALSYTFTSITTLLLHYLPGPIHTWQILILLNLVALVPFFFSKGRGTAATATRTFRSRQARPAGLTWPDRFQIARSRLHAQSGWLPLLLILISGLLLRTTHLSYSEFQGDEALAMISAAEALEGHEDALFLRSKGPGEVLLPATMWRLTGTITEAIARLPFTLASLLAIMTVSLIGETAENRRVGWLAAGFFAVNGFMVAFGRIVQYQALVIWLSALAFLLAAMWLQSRQTRLLILSGVFLGTGLLAHYDAVLILPAVAWLIFSGSWAIRRERLPLPNGADQSVSIASRPAVVDRVGAFLKSFTLFIVALLFVTLPFYLPFALNPQANRTGAYVGDRIGNQLRNNLPEFFQFTTFYSSSYYLILTGLLVLGLLAWVLWRARWSHWIVPVVALTGIVVVIVAPNLTSGLNQSPNLAILPFAFTFVGVFLAFPFTSVRQALLIWLAVPFLGYNFIVALGLTHIYTTVPAWSLLAALGWHQLITNNGHAPVNSYRVPISYLLLSLFFLLSTIFLWNAFVRHDIEYWQDYPEGNLAIFWDPYSEPPQAGLFGFAHRTGWKSIGQKIDTGELAGDYGSNEEPDVTAWYTRGAPRACDLQPEYYFLAEDLIDPITI